MRYTSSHPHAFRNRIAKSIGVLVAAALIATLGLPGAAQAQALVGTTISFADGDGFKIDWMPTRFETGEGIDNWIVTLTRPGGVEVVVDQYTDAPGVTAELGETGTRTLAYGRNDVGTWWAQVTACLVIWGLDDDDTGTADVDESASSCPSKHSKAGAAVGYTHGAFPAPANFAANAVPGGVALTWSPVVTSKKDQGFVGYEYRVDEGDEEGEWKEIMNASGALVVSDLDPGDYTFMLRVLGVSDNDLNTKESEVGGMAARDDETVPMPTPTLPEIAALFLAMLLLGSGAYLLRRRQSGGLTPA